MWQEAASMYGLNANPLVIHTLGAGTSGPYASALVVVVIVTDTTCTAVNDNVAGTYSNFMSIVQPDSLGEMSVWFQLTCPVDYPVASSITITATLSGSPTISSGQAVILIPEVGDTLYTGGGVEATATGSGSGTGVSLKNIDLAVDTFAANDQIFWAIGSTTPKYGLGAAIDGGQGASQGTGSGGDLLGVVTTDWMPQLVGSKFQQTEMWTAVHALGTGTRDLNYNIKPTTSMGAYSYAVAAVSFTKPLGPAHNFQSLTGGLSFTGNRSSFYQPFLTTTPVLSRSRPVLKTQIRAKSLSQQRPAAILQLRYQPLKAVQRTTTQLDSVPKILDVAVTETYPYQVDVSNYLTGSDTVTSIVSVLTVMSTGAVVASAWQGSISTTSNIIQVIVNAPVLQLGQQYQLATTFTASTGKRLTVISQLNMVA